MPSSATDGRGGDLADHQRDEFDDVPERSDRQGVHRDTFVPSRSGVLGLRIAVGVLLVLVMVAAALILPRLGLFASDQASSTPTSQEAPSAAVPSAVPSAVPTEVDRSVSVNVLNGTGVPDLAGTAAARLGAAGWTSAVPGNWAGAPLDTSVVFYSGQAQRAAAEAVAEDLGIGSLVETPDVSPDISAVLGAGFE